MPKPPLSLLRLFALVVPVLSGCYVPQPVAHADLHIASDGAYRLNGVPVPAPALRERIEAAERPGTDLVLQIHASPQADLAQVRGAVAAAEAAHARIAFAQEAPAL